MPRTHGSQTLLSFTVIALCALLVACETEDPSGRKALRAQRARSESIGHLGNHYRPGSVLVSRNHRRLAWVDDRGDRCRIVVDREKSPYFARCDNPLFSPDGTTVLHWAVIDPKDPDSVQLVVNGVASLLEFPRRGWTSFGRRGGGWAAVAPRRETGGPRDEPPAEGPSGDAAGPAARNSTPAAERMIVFGSKGLLGEHAATSVPAVSADGSRVAYVAADNAGLQSLYVDGVLQRNFGKPQVPFLPAVGLQTEESERDGPPLAPESTVAFLSDGTLAGVALGEQGWTVFHDDQTWAAYAAIRRPPRSGLQVLSPDFATSAAIMAGSLVVAEGIPLACWWERLNGEQERWRVVCNGEPIDSELCESASPVLPITMAANARAVAYLCQNTPPALDAEIDRTPRNLWVIAKGERHGPYRFVWGIELSADGKHLAFAASDEVEKPWSYFIDGRRITGPWQRAFPAKFSEDGSTVVWAASPEEEARRLDLVHDGDILARAEMVLAPPLFRGGGRAQWAIKRGKSVRRLTTAPAVSGTTL